MRGNKGQFFLLAAVIISSVIISFGAATNMAIVNDEPEDFYTSGEDVRREIAAFLDYAVFTGEDDELEDFLVLLAENMEEANPNVDFAFLYRGNGNKLEVRNYGFREFHVNDVLVEARGREERTITDEYGTIRTFYVNEEVRDDYINLGNVDSFSVKIEEDSDGVLFPFLDDQQVVFVMQKEERGDVYVSIR